MKGVETGLSETQEPLEAAKDLPVISTNHIESNYPQSVAGYRRSSAPLRCKVSGCTSDLASAPKTHQRFRLCNLHIKSPAILVDGVASRFCQQCSRFHPLTEFHGTNRTCRMMLVKNRARQRGANPCTSPHDASVVPTAWKQSATSLPLRAFHAAADSTAMSAITTPANMDAAAASAAGWGGAPHALAPALTQPSGCAPTDWQVSRARSVGLATTAAGAAVTASCPAAVGPLPDKPSLPEVQLPEGRPCTAPPVSPNCSSGASSEHPAAPCPSALTAPTATATAADVHPSELPGPQNAAGAGAGGPSPSPPPEGHRSANQPQTLSCTDSKSYKSGTVAIMPAISPPPAISVPCNPALLVSEGAPSIPQTSSVFAVEARCGDGVSIMAAEAGLRPGAGHILGSQADTAVTTAAAVTAGAFARSPSDGTAVTLAAISTIMAASPINPIAPETDLCIGPELENGVPDRHSLQNAQAAPPGTLASMTPSGGPFARCSAPPALCQPDWDNVGGQTLNMLRHWQRQMERDPDQPQPPQLQEERRPWLHPFQGMRLSRGPSAPQWERPSLQRILLLKQTSSSLRTRGDLHAASTSHVYGGGGPDGDGSGLSGSDGDLSWCSIANSTATLGGDERGGVGIGGGGSCNDNGVFFGGSGSGGNGGGGGSGGSGGGLMFGRMSAPPPDTAKLQTDFRCSASSSLLVSSTSVAALGCGPPALGALGETGGGGGGIWGLQRAGSFGNFKRRRSLGLEAAADDAAASVRHCSNAGLAEPALDGAVVAVMSGAVDKGLGEHLCLGPQLPVSPPPQGMATLPPSQQQQQQAVATMMRGLEKTPNMLAQCAPSGQNNNDSSNNNMSTAELWSPEVCLQNSGSLNDRGCCRGGRFGNGDDGTSGRGCSAGDGCASPLRQRCKPRWTHTVADGHGIRNPSLAVALAVEATTPPAVTTDGGGGSRGDGAQLTPRGMASLVLGALALDEEMKQGAIHTKAASSGAEAGAAGNAVAAHRLGTIHDTATGVTGSLSPVNGDSLLFASLAAEWQGEGEPDSADELLLGLDDAAAGSQIRSRHVEMQPQSQPPSMATMIIQQQQPQQMVQQLPAAIITEPLGPGLATTGYTSTSAMASAFVRSSTAAGWWSQSSFPGPSQKVTEATAAMRRERFLAPDLEMWAASGPTPMAKPSSGVIVEGGGPSRLVPGAQHMWFRSAQSEPAWGSRPNDIVCQQQQQQQQSPHHYRQHRLGQPSQPLPQQQHQLQHQQAAQHAGCNMEDGDRTASDSASGGALEGACDGGSQLPCRQQQDDSEAGTSSGMSGRKAIGEETEEQLQLLLGDLIGNDVPSQPWPAVAVAVAAQPAQLLPTLAPTSSLLQQMQQQYCGLPLPRLQAMDLSRQPPSPPLPTPQLQQSQQQQGPLVAEAAANMCVGSSDMIIDYPSQFVSAPVAVSGGSIAGAGCGSSGAAAHNAVLSPSTAGADAARHGLQVGQQQSQQQQQQHPDLHQHQNQQQRLPSRHEGLWLRDEQAIAEVIMADTAAASQSESLEAVPCTAAALASTAIASGGSTPTPCIRSQTTRDAFDGVVASSYGPAADFRYTINHPLSAQQQTLQQEKHQQHHVSSGHSGSSTRHSRRSHRCTNSARHDGVTRHDQDFLDKALQQQQQMWSELRTMQEQQRALLEQQLEQQRALAKLLGGALPATVGSTAAASGAVSAAAVTAIADGVGCASSSAAAAAAKTIANTSSLLEAWQKQRQQDDEQPVQGGGHGGSCRSLLPHQRPAMPFFGRSSMSVLRDGGNVENMSSMERDWQVQLQQLGTRLQQRQEELPDDLQSHPQEHHHELPLHGNRHGRLQFTRHSHQIHQPHEQHHQNRRQSSLRGVSSPAVLSPASPELHVLNGGCSGGVSSCT